MAAPSVWAIRSHCETTTLWCEGLQLHNVRLQGDTQAPMGLVAVVSGSTLIDLVSYSGGQSID